MFADPFCTAGLVIDPKMHAGFAFEVHDLFENRRMTFDCPEGPRQLIASGVNGLLVPQGDIGGLTEALRSLMDDPERRRALGAAGLESAREFEADAVVDRWIDLVEEIDADRAQGGGS